MSQCFKPLTCSAVTCIHNNLFKCILLYLPDIDKDGTCDDYEQRFVPTTQLEFNYTPN